MSKINFVLVPLFRRTDEDEEDYRPLIEELNGTEEVCEEFYLEDDGVWRQEFFSPFASDDEAFASDDEATPPIKGFGGNNDGERLLRFLNEEVAKKQIRRGIRESDVLQGLVILNNKDEEIHGKITINNNGEMILSS
jgi:hypothetical protein